MCWPKALFKLCSVTGVTILLSLTVFLNLVAETLPQVSDAIPLLGTNRSLSDLPVLNYNPQCCLIKYVYHCVYVIVVLRARLSVIGKLEISNFVFVCSSCDQRRNVLGQCGDGGGVLLLFLCIAIDLMKSGCRKHFLFESCLNLDEPSWILGNGRDGSSLARLSCINLIANGTGHRSDDSRDALSVAGVTILLSQTVFSLLVAHVITQTSDAVPLIG